MGLSAPGSGSTPPVVIVLEDTSQDLNDVWPTPSPTGTVVVVMNSMTAPHTVTLPDSEIFTDVGADLRVVIVDTSGSCSDANPISVVSVGDDLISNAGSGPAPDTTYEIAAPYGCLVLMIPSADDARKWVIVSGRQADWVDPVSGTFQADLVASLIGSGLMRTA